MPEIILPNLGVTSDWDLGQDGWKTGADTNWLILDALSHVSIIDFKPASLPVIASEGDRIIQMDNMIAVFKEGAFLVMQPTKSMHAYNETTKILYRYDGTTWVTVSASTLESAGPLVGVSPYLNGTIGLDNTVPTAAIEYISVNGKWYATGRELNTVTSAYTEDFVYQSEKGVADGVATLDATARIPNSQLPMTAMEYHGNYNATTNTPTLVDGTGTNGDVYNVATAGTIDLGSGSIDFYVGDEVRYNGTVWERVDGANADQDIADHKDVDLASNVIRPDNLLGYNTVTSKWENSANLLNNVKDVDTSVAPFSASTILGYNNATSKWGPTVPVVGNAWAYTAIVADVSAASGDFFDVDATPFAINITLPTAIGVQGQKIAVRKRDTTINYVNVLPVLAQTISGKSRFVLIADEDLVTFVSNGTNWLVESYYAPHAQIIGSSGYMPNPWPVGTATYFDDVTLLLPVGVYQLSASGGTTNDSAILLTTFFMFVSAYSGHDLTDDSYQENRKTETVNGNYDNPQVSVLDWKVEHDVIAGKNYYLKFMVASHWPFMHKLNSFFKAVKVG